MFYRLVHRTPICHVQAKPNEMAAETVRLPLHVAARHSLLELVVDRYLLKVIPAQQAMADHWRMVFLVVVQLRAKGAA